MRKARPATAFAGAVAVLPQQSQQVARIVVALEFLTFAGEGAGAFVEDERFAENAELEPGFLGPQAEVGLFMDEEERLVDEADLLDDAAPHHQAAAVDDVDIDDLAIERHRYALEEAGLARLVEGHVSGLHLRR